MLRAIAVMSVEHRMHGRTNLRVPLFLLPEGAATPIHTQTENVGVDGFYCNTTHLFSPGEIVKYLLFLPPAASEPLACAGVCVQGEAEVVRISIGPSPGEYGVGYRSRAYRILPDSDLLTNGEAIPAILDRLRSTSVNNWELVPIKLR